MADERSQYGGQAVVEGVMMRSPRYFAVACRRLSDNQIVIELEPVETSLRKFMWLNKPFLRGTLALIDAMALGMKALTYAANVQTSDLPAGDTSEIPAAGAVNLALGEGAPSTAAPAKSVQTINGIAIGTTTVLALVLGFSLFWILPQFLTDRTLLPHLHRPLTAAGSLGVNFAEGGIRLLIFFLYIGVISRLSHVQRVFQYHGAEHKAINTLESGLAVTVENARAASRIHPRCGTNFIFIVLLTSILVFSIIPRHAFSDGPLLALQGAGLRLLLLPVVAGVAYEILKFAGQNRDKKWAQAMIAPGLWTQYLTTRVPDDSQIEVAIAALDSVWAKEHEVESPAAPDPSGEPAVVVA